MNFSSLFVNMYYLVLMVLFFFSFLLPWQPQLWMEFNSLNNFIQETSLLSFIKAGPQVQENKMFKELLTDGQMDTGQRPITIPHFSTSCSGALNPFPNKPWFLRVCSTNLLKTPWEKEKLLIMSNFSFSHSVFYPFGELPAIFIKYEIIVCKLFQLGPVQYL